jgi:hypothetical protein
MNRVLVALACVSVVALAAPHHARGEESTRKDAAKVTSYVLLAETVARVSLQVGDMLRLHPQDRAVAAYAKEMGRLNATIYAKLKPPKGTEILHKRFGSSVENFGLMADAYAKADYKAAARHRIKCVEEFTKSLQELIRMKKRGIMP